MKEKTYISLLASRRFLLIVACIFIADVFIFGIAENSILSPGRWVFSVILSLILPGYCLIVALFPSKEFETVQMICLSVSLSFGIFSLEGLLLTFLLGTLNTTYFVVFLSISVLVLNVFATLRQTKEMARRREPM